MKLRPRGNLTCSGLTGSRQASSRRAGLTALALMLLMPALAPSPAHGSPPATSAGSPPSTATTGQDEASRQARALLVPQQEALLSSEIAGRIDSLPFRSGQRFRKGDVLASLDCTALQAALAEAQARMKAAELMARNQKELASLKSAGTLSVALAEAEAERERAHVATLRVPVEHCTIRAPFSGRVVERKANPHEIVAPGQPLLAILDDSQLEIRVMVPSRWLADLVPGQAFQLHIDETGQTITARISRIGARIDPVSQSAELTGLVEKTAGTSPGKAEPGKTEPGKTEPEKTEKEDSTGGLMAGMSGSALFSRQLPSIEPADRGLR